MPVPQKHPDLHGNVPDHCHVAVVLVDVLNALRFEGSEAFVPRALEVARRIAALKKRALEARVPVVYVNDNAGPTFPRSSQTACATTPLAAKLLAYFCRKSATIS
jgi:nicotinamidase-related amidase